MTNQEKEKAAFQSVYDSGFKDALQAAWQAVNVLGAPETARITQEDKFFCEGIEGALQAIERLQTSIHGEEIEEIASEQAAEQRASVMRRNLDQAGNGWYTVAQAAGYLQVCNITILRWIKAGTLPASKIGKSYRVAKTNLDEMAKGNTRCFNSEENHATSHRARVVNGEAGRRIPASSPQHDPRLP